MIIPTRRTILLGLVPLLLVAASGGAPVVIEVAWALVLLILAAWLIDGLGATSTRRLLLDRSAPAQVYFGQSHPVEWIAENRSAETIVVELRDQLPEGCSADPRTLFARIAPNSRVRLRYHLVPGQRGDLEFGDLFFRIQGRLGLAWKLQRLKATQAIRCYPHLGNWTAAELATREALVRQTGSHRWRWRGTGTIFESLRDYTTEDDFRWIDWKATARARRPIARNYETERHQQVILLIDSSRMMSTYCGHRTKFDTALEAVVLAAHAAVDQGDSVGLLVFADKVQAYLHPRRDRTQVGAIMNSLYSLGPSLVEPDFETAITLAATRNRRRSLMLLFTDVTVIESARRMTTYVRSLIPRHLPLVVTIADETVEKLESLRPRSAEEFYQVGVANELLQQRDELLEILRASGAAVLDSPADQIATQTIKTYLDLKRRMRL
ncbi:MAG TPA: DUF58 domain-containing protein [Pirellulales bacterium]|nr:DUF58 domain-containing protein [Pirellulales bacterium]